MPTACANDIENKVIGVMAEFMDIDAGDFRPSAKLMDDLGIDSLDLAEVELELESMMGIEFPLDMDAPVTVGDFIEQVRKLMAGR